MEPQKDNNTQPTSNKISANSENNVDHISFFEKDNYFIFVYKKTEKLATALYMVTNLFSDSEPMKWTLRKKVSEMLSFILGHKNSVSGQAFFITSIKDRVLDVVSLLEVSSKSGLVSPMNFSILRQEFLNLVRVLDEQKLEGGDSSVGTLPKSFFEVPRDFSPVMSDKKTSDGYGDIATMSNINIKDKTSENMIRDVFKRTNRQNIILGLLKKKKELSIKDIAQTIRDCSEKTIQRELISLIDSGVIKKTGERRWSKYSLII
jgi:hypothetical protein